MIKYRSYISQEELNKLRKTEDFDSFEGVLADNYIFYNTDHLKPKIKGKKINPTRYIIVRENSVKGMFGYTMELEAILTDDIMVVEEWENHFMDSQ